MKALMKRSREAGDIALVDLPMPTPKRGQVLARVAYVGICGSDLDILHSHNTIYRPPVVQGHEFSAVAVAVGDGVNHVKVGDKLVSETTLEVCGECEACHIGDYHLCTRKEVIGWTSHGAFAEFVLLNGAYVHVLAPQDDLQSAALIEPLAIAAEAISVKGRLRAGESVAVIGPGTTGILSAILAQALGAKQVFLIGRDSSLPARFPIAHSLGLEHCVNSTDIDPISYVRQHNDKQTCELVIDATGSEKGFELALELISRNHRIVELGSITGTTRFPWSKAAWKALELSFVYSSSRRAWTEALAFFSTRGIELKKMVTDTVPLEQYERAFSRAATSRDSLKVMFQP